MDNTGIRINKYLSEAGVCSRREADRLIEAGKVMINNNAVTCGTKVFPGDIVYVNGKKIVSDTKPVVLLYNKPKGVVCSTAEKDNIVDYIGFSERIYPVGRLDKDSTGLIFLTNQGDIHDAMLRVSNHHEKEYLVRVNKPIDTEFEEGMKRGVPILNTVTMPCRLKRINDYEFTIILTQGLNRQIRRMCAYFDYRVRTLKRIRIMDYNIGTLKEGEYRIFNEKQINELKKKLWLPV
ncbi:MAG: pseudouridine synthase [Lachnospiraceae bacterium]